MRSDENISAGFKRGFVTSYELRSNATSARLTKKERATLGFYIDSYREFTRGLGLDPFFNRLHAFLCPIVFWVFRPQYRDLRIKHEKPKA